MSATPISAFPKVTCAKCGGQMVWTVAWWTGRKMGEVNGLWCPECDIELEAHENLSEARLPLTEEADA